jgi:hypothetical protein
MPGERRDSSILPAPRRGRFLLTHHQAGATDRVFGCSSAADRERDVVVTDAYEVQRLSTRATVESTRPRKAGASSAGFSKLKRLLVDKLWTSCGHSRTVPYAFQGVLRKNNGVRRRRLTVFAAGATVERLR